MQSVDSVAPSTNVVEEQIPEGEQSMANPQEAELPKVDVQTPVAVEAPKSRAKTPRVKKAKPEPVKRTPKAVSKAAESEPAVAPSKRRTYSGKERAQKIAQIRKLIAGGSSVKSAVAEVKISEQTYYYWMKAVPAEESDDLKDLVALEAENKELKKRLAEHLRKENAELKRKLGI
jgi:transposase-like protein